MTQSKSAKVGSMIALVTSGVVAGGVLAGSLSASAADAPAKTYGSVTNPNPGDPSKPQRADETLLTGDTLAKVKAAVLAKYPGATFVRVETDSDGAYEAHITKAEGTPVTVEVSKAFAVTGEEAGGRGGPGGPGGRGPHGTPVDAATLAKIKSAVAAKYPGATVEDAHTDADGSYDARVTKKDGTKAIVELDKAFAVAGEKAPREGRGGGPHGTPVDAATLAKIKSAVAAKYPGATVNGAHQDADGSYDAMVTKKDGTRAVVELDKAFAVTGEKTRPAGAPGGHGDRGAPPSGTTQSG